MLTDRLQYVSAKSTNRPEGKSTAGAATAVKKDGCKVLLLDGHSLAYRAFFALPETLVTSSGQITNAVYGFTAMLIKLLGDERPDAVVVCFDKGAPQFRLDRYAEYKAGRAETPDKFRQQLPLIREVLEALRIPMVEREGYEADDLLATLTKHCRVEGHDVVVVTGDRDILQLVREGVSVMMTRRGISDIIRYDVPTVLERYGVAPEKWTDFVALKGETSDNLPGVPGVGEKTAAQLIHKYGDIEAVIAHAGELSPKLREAIQGHAEQVRINKELGRLLDDVSLELDAGKIGLEPWDEETVRKLFTALEFRTLHERLKALKIHAAAAPPALELKSVSELASEEDLSRDAAVALAWSADWLALCDRAGTAWVLPFSTAVDRLAGFLKDSPRHKIAHDAKSLYRAALTAGVEVQGLVCDTKIAAYLLEPGSTSGYTVRDTVGRYLGVSLDGDKSEPQAGEQVALS
ncbi:MAG: 5'-3' exonuclease H3TH domain-containing protein, partial [Candidatus Binatia bacterium]